MKIHPDDINLEFNLGIMNYHGKKYEEAIDIFNSVIKKVDQSVIDESELVLTHEETKALLIYMKRMGDITTTATNI